MSDVELRNYLGVLSFLLAALSFLANERREAINALRESSKVSKIEKAVGVCSVLLPFLAAVGLVLSAWPAVSATGLGPSQLLHLHTAVREAFVLGWVLLIAITLALGGLLARAFGVEVQQG
jgi:hypothetical protein